MKSRAAALTALQRSPAAMANAHRVSKNWRWRVSRAAMSPRSPHGKARIRNRGLRRMAVRLRRRTLAIGGNSRNRSEEHTSELQSLMRISYAVFCLKQKKKKQEQLTQHNQ